MGARYAPRFGYSGIQPFGQVLAGVAHSSGSLTQIPADKNASAAYAANVGAASTGASAATSPSVR